MPTATSNGRHFVYDDETSEYLMEKYCHNALLDEIASAFRKGDKARCGVLWHCYDVMYGPPEINWDLKWRRSWGYPG